MITSLALATATAGAGLILSGSPAFAVANTPSPGSVHQLGQSGQSGVSTTPLFVQNALNHTCGLLSPQTSCRNTAPGELIDGCCASDTLTVITQFWSTSTGKEKEGLILPKGSWSTHGLWPDYCDGSYGQYFDLTRQYDPEPSPKLTTPVNGTVVPPFMGGDIVTPILERFGRYDLLAWMRKYFIAKNQDNYVFWQHEFSKHATGFSTFDIGCYGPTYIPGQDIVDFFSAVAAHQIPLDTYTILREAGITPSNDTSITYPLSAISGALENFYGATPYLGCGGVNKTILSEIWYFAHSVGKVQDAKYLPVDRIGKNGCSEELGIQYLERTVGSEA